MEELLSRHRKEIRDLTSRITQKKKSATKKTRKGVNTECESLERGLKERHALEIAELDSPRPTTIKIGDDAGEGEAEGVETTTDASPEPIAQESKSATTATNPDTPPPPVGKKPSRRKAQLARRAAELAALSASAEAEASLLPDLRSRELSAMQTLLDSLQLTEREIAPDGHCLYSAFADQVLTPASPQDKLDYKLVRRKCAEYMVAHRDDFEPFLEVAFEEHVRKVGEAAEWGGQTEVLALAKAFGVVVNVVQAEGRGVERMNDEVQVEGKEEVWLGYYRHSFGLGEHYNSLRKKKA